MSDDLFQQPILNWHYAPPARHWKLDSPCRRDTEGSQFVDTAGRLLDVAEEAAPNCDT